MKRIIVILVFLALHLNGTAQEKLSSEEKQQNIALVAKLLDSIYVFPDKAKEANALIQEKHEEGAYDKIDTPDEFAEALTTDLRSVTHDLHINMRYDPVGIAKQQKQDAGEKAGMIQAERVALENYGFEEVKILSGKVGYPDLRFFYSPKEAAETAIATMKFHGQYRCHYL